MQIVRKRNSDLSSQVILTAIENKQPCQDSLENHFGWGLSLEDPGPLSKAGYESFKNIGMDILRNKELKKEIIFLFEDIYAQSETQIARLMGYTMELVRLRQDYLMRKTGFNFVPFDYEKLILDEHFHSWVVTIKDSRGWGRIAMEESLEETKRVLLLIEGELKF